MRANTNNLFHQEIDDNHVDNWLDSNKQTWMENDGMRYAVFILELKRASAADQGRYPKIIQDMRLFGTYQGNRIEITMASRIGDLGYNYVEPNVDYSGPKQFGYQHRGLYPGQVSEWSNNPFSKEMSYEKISFVSGSDSNSADDSNAGGTNGQG